VAGAAVALCVLLLVSACSGIGSDRPATSDQVVVTGSSTIAPLVNDLARRFETQHPGVRVDVQTGGSSRGISDVRQGLAGLGMVSRALGEAEADLSGYRLALDGVALIVHASNPLANLTQSQVVAIFTGRTRDWSELGGDPGPITVVHKADGRSTQEVFLGHFSLDPGDVEPAVVIGDNEQGVKSVAGNAGAIGYVSIGAAEASVGLGVPIKLIALDGHPASTDAVARGTFPLVRELNLVSIGQLSPIASDFVEFARSPSAREFIEAHYFVALD
jgi:phosphate transport system substrate-binding protein